MRRHSLLILLGQASARRLQAMARQESRLVGSPFATALAFDYEGF